MTGRNEELQDADRKRSPLPSGVARDMTEEKIDSISAFLKEVRHARENWRLANKNELWFRGESRDHQETLLRPELYRPRKSKALRNVEDLLDIEVDLHEEFQRCADQFRSEELDPIYWQWDTYFLLQHHGGATRLLARLVGRCVDGAPFCGTQSARR